MLFNQLYIQRLVCMTFAPPIPAFPPPPDSCCSLPLPFFLFWAFGYAHPQLKSFYPLSTFDDAHVQALPACTTSMLTFRSGGAWKQEMPLVARHFIQWSAGCMMCEGSPLSTCAGGGEDQQCGCYCLQWTQRTCYWYDLSLECSVYCGLFQSWNSSAHVSDATLCLSLFQQCWTVFVSWYASSPFSSRLQTGDCSSGPQPTLLR